MSKNTTEVSQTERTVPALEVSTKQLLPSTPSTDQIITPGKNPMNFSLDKGEIALPLDLFENKKKYYPLVFDKEKGIIAYVGHDGIYTIGDIGLKLLGETASPYKITPRKGRQVELTINKDGEKFNCIKIKRVNVAIALKVLYKDTENLDIRTRDGNAHNVDISNLRYFQGIYVPTKHSFEPIIIDPKVTSISELLLKSAEARDRINKMAAASYSQKMPTQHFDGMELYPFQDDVNSGVIFYVGKEGILSCEEYAKKIMGIKYNVINPYIGSDGYMMVSTKKGMNDFQFRLSRLKVCVALEANYRDFDQNLEVDHIDQNIMNNSIHNLHILTKKDHAAKTLAFNRSKLVNANSFNIKPVELVTTDGDVLRSYSSLDEAAEKMNVTKDKIKNYISQDKTSIYTVDDKSIECRWEYSIQPYIGETKLIDDAKIWYDLVSPDTGEKFPGYKISNNFILELPTGRLSEGIRKSYDTRRWEFRVKKNRHADTRWGEASRLGRAIPKELDMAHTNNQYDKVTMDTVRLTTHTDNMNDTVAKKVVAIWNDRSQDPKTYASIKLAADAHGIRPSTLGSALRENRATYKGITFRYRKDDVQISLRGSSTETTL
jgi:hypothetical protein